MLKLHACSASRKEPSNLPIQVKNIFFLHVCKHTSAAKVIAFEFEAFFQCAHSLCQAAAKKKRNEKINLQLQAQLQYN
jgi:hypothetical protein